jgi:hypothetical protein
VELFYKLFLIDTKNRQSTQLCPFVKNGGMHRSFQPHLRSDGLGIDYSKIVDFDTRGFLEKIFESQRPGGEKWLRDAMAKKSKGDLDNALENARRIGIDRVNSALYQSALTAAKSLQ